MLQGIDTDRYKCIVIGAGVCGAIAAHRISELGYETLVLEAGPDQGGKRLQFAGDYAVAHDKHPGSPYSKAGHADIIGPDNSKGTYYDFLAGEKFASTFLRIGGGSTWHFLGNVPRFIPEDFKLNCKFSVGVDWPLSYDDIETEYGEAEKEMGVSGDHEQWNGYLDATRSTAYPMTKIWQSYGDSVFLEKVDNREVEGKTIKIMSTPQARNSTIYDGRPACAGNSTCVPICPIHAKYDATATLRKAVKATVCYDTLVSKLETDDSGNIKTIHCIDVKSKTSYAIAVNGRIVILAIHAIETPRLMLYSGLAQKSGQVGKNLMDHLQGYCTAISKTPVYPFRGPITTSGIDVFRKGEHREQFAAFRMSIGNDGWGRRESPYQTLWNHLNRNLMGKELMQQVRERVIRMTRISFSTEMLPEAINAVTLSPKKDQFDLPRPAIRFTFPEYNKKAFLFAYRCSSTIMKAAGCEVDDTTFDPDRFSGAGHIVGTTRMGETEKDSVVDSYGRVHEHKNLYIVGPSVFPTSGTANPTLTAAALTIRTIKYLAAKL